MPARELVAVLALVAGCSSRPTPERRAPERPSPIGTVNGVPIFATGLRTGTLADGSAILDEVDGRWQPRPPTALPLALGRLDERSRIALVDGSLWVWMSFATDGPPLARWIPPAHARAEVERRLAELTAETARLPTALAARVLPHLPVIALVSATEGDFSDPARSSEDTMASLGLFQWATDRKLTRSAGSTLSRFFSDLQRRALADEDPLYLRAWKQCAARGLGLRSGELLLDKRRATGGAVERRLRAEMGTGALRSYQLIAATDWIEQIRGTVVRPGFRGGALVGHAYAEANSGRLVTFHFQGRRIELRAERVLTAGELLRSKESLATAVSLGVNRPHYVEAALWRALVPDASAERVESLLAADDRRGLGALVWPATAPDESVLLMAFRNQALALYRPQERERRARRLATAER